MIKSFIRIILVIIGLLISVSSSFGLDVYLNSLGYINLDIESIAKIKKLSNLLQWQLMRISNDKITYQPLYTDQELNSNYDKTIVDSKLGALAACIVNQVDTVLYGVVDIDPRSRLSTVIITVYNKTTNENIAEILESKILPDDFIVNFAQDLSVRINVVIYKYLTGEDYTVPFATLVPPPDITPEPVSTPSPTPTPAPTATAVITPTLTPTTAITPTPTSAIAPTPFITSAENPTTTVESQSDMSKVLEMLNTVNLKLDAIQEMGIIQTSPTAKATKTPAPTPKPTTVPVKTIIRENVQPEKNQAHKRAYTSFYAGAGYFFPFSGKWVEPVISLATIEEGLRVHIYLIDKPLFKILIRQCSALNYAFSKENPLNVYNRYIHLHAFKARLGLELYTELLRFAGLYLGGGVQYSYNAVDLRTANHEFYADSHYALGAYANTGFEILIGDTLGIGLNNILDITFFEAMALDYKLMLLLSFKI